jgi:hypothetical protein
MTTRRSLALALAAVVILFAAALAVWTPRFRTNDDPLVAMIASGRGIALAPDPHLVFSHVLLGGGLNALYALGPHQPWYGLYLVLFQLLGHVVLAAFCLRRLGKGAGLGLYTLFFLCVGLPLLLDLQFTSTAVFVTSVGLLALLSPAPGRNGELPEELPGSHLAGAVLLVVLGSLVRFDGLVLALVPAAALAVVRLPGLSRAERRRRWRAIVAALLLALGLRVADRAAYRLDPEWRAFVALNDQLRVLLDWRRLPYGPRTAATYAEAGFSENDAALLRTWFYADASVFSAARLEKLVQAARTYAAEGGGPSPLARLRTAFQRDAFHPLALVFPVLAWLGSPTRRHAAGLLAAALTAGAAAVWLAVSGRAPFHVLYPLVVFPCAAALLQATPDARRRSVVFLVAAVLAIPASFVAARRAAAESADARDRNRELKSSLAELGTRADRLVVAWAAAIPFEAILPLEETGYLDGLRLYSLGWPERSPVADRMLQAFGIDDLARALVERTDVLLATPSERLPLLATYAREHMGRTVRLTRVLRTRSFSVFAARASDAAPAPEEPGADP